MMRRTVLEERWAFPRAPGAHFEHMKSRSRVLVAYQSRHGSTREIAERLAESLRVYGRWDVELRLAEELSTLDPYDAVVFGSPVYDGKWLPEAEAFVRGHLQALAARPLWLFSVGSFGDTQRLIGRFVTQQPRVIGFFLEALHPRSYRMFAGVIDAKLWPWYGRLVLRLFGRQAGDNRDWLEIDRWIEHIASDLQRLFSAEVSASGSFLAHSSRPNAASSGPH